MLPEELLEDSGLTIDFLSAAVSLRKVDLKRIFEGKVIPSKELAQNIIGLMGYSIKTKVDWGNQIPEMEELAFLDRKPDDYQVKQFIQVGDLETSDLLMVYDEEIERFDPKFLRIEEIQDSVVHGEKTSIIFVRLRDGSKYPIVHHAKTSLIRIARKKPE